MAYTLQTRIRGAFTLVELLLAMVIISLIVVLMASILGGVSRAWVTGEQRVETFQNGRATLELVARDLSQAVISPKLQFIQDPDGESSRFRTSSSLYWQAPIASTPAGNLCQLGYYLDNQKGNNFELKRLCVPPDNATYYRIFAASPAPSSGYDQANRVNQAQSQWLTEIFRSPNAYTGASAVYTTVSAGVLGMWIRCLDINAEPIPWYRENTAQGSSVKYNSAACFQPAVPGKVKGYPEYIPSNNLATPVNVPPYTNAVSTLPANALPSAVEVTIITLDRQTLMRNPNITQLVSFYPQPSNGPLGIPDAIRTFNNDLINHKINNARTFSTVVKLVNTDK